MTQESSRTLNEERPFYFHELFFSTTDCKGKITSWNEVFARISGYVDSELLNKPHSLIRHPDMPRGVFQLLWDMILQQEVVGAYVKNQAADGRFYWVYALVLPVSEGFLSIRLKPSSDFFHAVKSVYTEILGYENNLLQSGEKKIDVAQKGKDFLLQKLTTLGFKNYRDFMKASLPAEILAREEFLRLHPVDKDPAQELFHSGSSLYKIRLIEKNLDQLFRDLSKSLELANTIKSNFHATHDLAHQIKRGALNATIEASRLASDGKTLFVLADYLGKNGTTTVQELSSAEMICRKSLDNVADILFEVCAAKLQTEALSYFIRESELETSSIIEMNVDPMRVLTTAFKAGIENMTRRYSGLEEAFSSVLSVLEGIRRLFVSLKIAHVSAKAESSRIDSGQRFSQIFEQVYAVVEQGRMIIDQTATRLEGYIAVLQSRSYDCSSIRKNTRDFSTIEQKPQQ
jgi:PAS domain S-box-containing protein